MYLRLMAGTVFTLSLAGAVALGQHYTQTNLVSNESGAAVTDSDLVNPWGMSRSSSSPWWISDNGTGLATLYNGAGTKISIVVTIPAAVSGNTGSPSGTIYNGNSTDFLLGPGLPARFLFVTEDGTIAGWNPGAGLASGATPPSTMAVTMVKTTDGSVFKGMTSAYIGANTYLYVANFGKGRVDVYDNAFKRVHLGEDSFMDEEIPDDYAPFNVQTIGNDIVVSYAMKAAGATDETDGPGLGRIDLYSSSGRLLTRFQHGSWLNAPWGIALAPDDFGHFSHDLLVGQFGSGNVAAYDLATGHYKGLLEDASGAPIAIDGLWALSVGNVSTGNYNTASSPAAEVYFSAGPGNESGGLLGYLTAVSSELLKGNDQ
jgi:uncharacterized protein (TIGR03118 family)